MTGFLLIGSAVAAVCVLRAIAACGWPAWLALLVAVSTFGGDATGAWHAVLYGALTFTALIAFRRML